ncbi:hypothetical protein M0R45_020403 [Rubus argutus]|uniref:Rad60/SUMO-like domain-containing protein n=1 Tax=Rubus argutus TaxID=59490 RepID=A0AAW1X8S7_RUBAR
MSGNAPQGSSSEAKSEVTFLADEDQKPNIHSNPEFVNLKIYYQQDGSVTNYRVRRSTKLQKLLVAFCTHRSLDMKLFAILIDGHGFNLERTPQELQMEDGDEIEVMIHSSGGSTMLET